MAIGNINPGFLGIADIGTKRIRCNDFNVNLKQEALFYDHTIGLRDNIPTYLFEGKGDTGQLNPQKIIWRPGVKICQGGIGFYMDEDNVSTLFDEAKRGSDFDMSFTYTCNDIKRNFYGCKVNNYTFSVTASDIATVSADIMAMDMEDSTGIDLYTEERKIVTWDDIKVIVDGVGDIPIQSITFSVNNNCMPIYTAGANNDNSLSPLKIRVGMQEITGTISYYNKGDSLKFFEDVISPSTINITSSDGYSVNLNVIFKPQERAGSVSAVISPLAFVGVDFALGE
jgi:hypothetical protein